jgi:hypothetical protein
MQAESSIYRRSLRVIFHCRQRHSSWYRGERAERDENERTAVFLGWDESRVKKLIAHYDSLSEEEQVAEDEAAVADQRGQTVITVPDSLLPTIRQLLADAGQS